MLKPAQWVVTLGGVPRTRGRRVAFRGSPESGIQGWVYKGVLGLGFRIPPKYGNYAPPPRMLRASSGLAKLLLDASS